MTEKAYGGSTGIPAPKNSSTKPKSSKTQKQTVKTKNNHSPASLSKSKEKSMTQEETQSLTTEEISKLKQAGKIAKQVKEFARSIIKKDVSLLEIANKIDDKILSLNAKPAFPVNLSINEVAAHATPAHNSEEKAHGLLKFDVGVHIDGFVADTAFSLDLENKEENKKLIEAAEAALASALNTIKYKTPLNKIGATIEKEIKSRGFQPVANLSGHSIDQYDLHSGITVPNIEKGDSDLEIEQGVYAIEPFATSGFGHVINGKPSGIYALESDGQVRDTFAREILAYIKEEYQTLPFCSRWLVKKFGSRALIALKRLEDADILHHHPQLIEKDRKPVAQAEHTIIITKDEKIVTT